MLWRRSSIWLIAFIIESVFAQDVAVSVNETKLEMVLKTDTVKSEEDSSTIVEPTSPIETVELENNFERDNDNAAIARSTDEPMPSTEASTTLAISTVAPKKPTKLKKGMETSRKGTIQLVLNTPSSTRYPAHYYTTPPPYHHYQQHPHYPQHPHYSQHSHYPPHPPYSHHHSSYNEHPSYEHYHHHHYSTTSRPAYPVGGYPGGGYPVGGYPGGGYPIGGYPGGGLGGGFYPGYLYPPYGSYPLFPPWFFGNITQPVFARANGVDIPSEIVPDKPIKSMPFFSFLNFGSRKR